MTKKTSDALPGDAEDRDPVLVEVGQRLIDARLDYGRRLKPIRAVSQAEIGRLIGVTGVTVGAWEAGKNDAGTSMLYRLADLYGVRRAWLLAGDGDMRVPRAGNVNGAADTHGAQLVPTDTLTAIESGDDLRKALGEPPTKGKKPGRAS